MRLRIKDKYVIRHKYVIESAKYILRAAELTVLEGEI